MRIGKKNPNNIKGKDFWTEVASTTIQLEPAKLILNTDEVGAYDKCAYSNGTGAILTAPDHADWDVFGSNSSNYTIDAWVKYDTSALGTCQLIQQTVDTNNY